MKKILKSLSVALAILLAMTLSFAVLADNESTADESAVSETSEVSTEASADASDDASAATSDDASAETSDEASKEETSKEETSKDTASKDETSKGPTSDKTPTTPTAPVEESTFPWARVITLIVIVVLILLAVILSKTQTKLGLRIAKFFKEYWSEIKKVSWYSPKDTAKATGIVLVVIIVAAVVIGLLDLGFAKIIELLANLFN